MDIDCVYDNLLCNIIVFLYRLQTFVFVRVVFLKIGHIDTINQTFDADIYIQASWRENKLDGKQLVSPNDLYDKYDTAIFHSK